MKDTRNHQDLQQAIQLVASEALGRAVEIELTEDGDRFSATISGYGTKTGDSFWEPLVEIADAMLLDPTIGEGSKSMLRAEVSRAPTLPPQAPAPSAPPVPPAPPAPPSPPAPPAPPTPPAPPSDPVTVTVLPPPSADADADAADEGAGSDDGAAAS